MRVFPNPVWLLLLAALPCVAQESASFRLVEHALNAGGVPAQGEIHTSTAFRLTLESIAGPVGHGAAASQGQTLAGGLLPGLAPPTEVTGLRFADGDTLTWNGHAAAGQFRVYRDGLDGVGPAVGSCLADGVAAPTADDASQPAEGQGFAYLVSVANTLGEEGPVGSASDGTPRTLVAPCP